ncbi:helix-turn-helix transcriptional regulator [Streptomyces sp. MMBL 11-1]|uniref:helix-turn-helix transcriptional regulator n=1 Tax=Streptomyces sp. MMBL 11-1 TaxID=3026420 RepID=UPI002360F24F|nr:response regulator transcription factor [Streptomyces sp. MMBL 11-1]
MKGPGRSAAPVGEPILVNVAAADALSRAGLVAQLRPHPEVCVLDEGDSTEAAVLVLVADTVDENVRVLVLRTSRTTTMRTLLVVTSIDEQHLVSAVESGVTGIVRRADASPEHLIQAIRSVARRDGHLPGDLLGQLLTTVGTVQKTLLGPRGLYFAGLNDRERNVLRLLADGHDTSDVAESLGCSQRTVKKILTDLMHRLNLRNRTQAVAYALRNDLI